MFVCYKVNANREEYAMGVHMLYLVLFVALMDKPSRDFGIVNRFSRMLSLYLMCQIPKSLMSFEAVSGLAIDVADPQQQIRWDLQPLKENRHALANTCRPKHLLRSRHPK